MDTLKVRTLKEALVLVGHAYRTKDNSQPADPVRKILAQLEGSDDMTLAEWVEARKSRAGTRVNTSARPKKPAADLCQVLEDLQRMDGQAELRDAIARLSLGAADWKTLARKLTGRSTKSGAAAREAVETHLSDRLLIEERVSSVKQLFG
ncbi:MAG: hypothetical protein KTR19_08680 [Hyphomicrobiales bacterium]|nr:hypothetical protein [Hyphomicrobiales bacterium]